MLAAREPPIAITLRSQFAFRINGTPVVPRRNSRDRQNSALSTAARIKRMLNEFIAQNRVSVVRNGVQSSTHISARHNVLSFPPIFSLFLFLDTLARLSSGSFPLRALSTHIHRIRLSTLTLICTRWRNTRVFGVCKSLNIWITLWMLTATVYWISTHAAGTSPSPLLDYGNL